MPFKLASLLLFASTAFGAPVYPKMECGVYQASGKLRRSKQGDFVLIVREGTSSPWEFILNGGEPKEKFLRNRTKVSVEFYVPIAFSTPEHPMVFFKKFLKDEPKEPLVKVRAEACGKS